MKDEDADLPGEIRDFKTKHLYSVMAAFEVSPELDTARAYVAVLQSYVDYIINSPYSPIPGSYESPDRQVYLPVVGKELKWAQDEVLRLGDLFRGSRLT